MSYQPRCVVPFDPVFVGTFGTRSLGLYQHGLNLGVPTSSASPAANRAWYAPFYVARPYPLARWWWQNGATVGTNYIQLAIYDENLNLFKASPKTLSAGTANHVQYANPGIHGTNVTAGSDSTDATNYTTASVTLKAGVLYLLSVENSKGSTADAVSSIDNGPTFTSRSSVTFNASNVNRVSIWSAVPTTDYTGTLKINFGVGNTQTGCVWSLSAFYHVDTATNDGVVQNATGTGNSTTPLATLAAFGSANNATFGAFGQAAAAGGAPSTGYFEMSDTTASTPPQALQTDYRPDNDTTVDETITSAQWGACAVEIKSLGTGAVMIPAMRGYLGFWCNGTTATNFTSSSFASLQPYGYLESSLTVGFKQVATPATSAGSQRLVNCGFTSRATP